MTRYQELADDIEASIAAGVLRAGDTVARVTGVLDYGLATNLTDATASSLKRLYGKRWGIECGFRDTKDPRFGMGMGSIRVRTPGRRDRLWLLNALAIALLTLLGAAGEALGYDRQLKSNTTKRRTHSLFRQGCMLYDLIPTMPDQRLIPLIETFAAMLAEQPVFADTFGAI